jgi:dihydrofolate reductase
MGHHLLVGRRTFESIGRALPGREIIVVSRGNPELPEHVHSAASVDNGIARARDYGETELFVGGGRAIFAATLPLCDRIYLTQVEAEVEGDVRFPETDWGRWRETEREQLAADDTNEHATTFRVLEREEAP